MTRTVRNFGRCLVKACVVDGQINHVLGIEGHDVIRTGANVIFRSIGDAIDMVVLWRSELLHHFQDVAVLGRIEGGGGKDSGEAIPVFDSDCGRKPLRRSC